MKNMRPKFVLFILLFSFLSPFNCQATYKSDIDQDGDVTSKDAVLGLQIVSGQSPDTPQISVDTDVNDDGKIGLTEVVYGLRYQSYHSPSCLPPVSLYDVSQPTTIVGNGTAESCTGESLQNAANIGGTIVFNCGNSPQTITLTSPVIFTKPAILDGGNLITLSGNDSTRILYLDSAYNETTPLLVVQRLTFRSGSSIKTGDDTADGGGAIYRDGGSLTVIECSFINNQSHATGQDLAGGAIYGFGGGQTIIIDSTFTGNSASNGGAVGSLNGDLLITNSTFTQNSATGTGGNPGQGGCGGAVYMDGRDEETVICGVKMAENNAGAIGGAFFRVSNDNTGTFSMDSSTIDSNQVTATDGGNAGGLYLHGLNITATNSTISRNQAFYNGGIWINTSHAQMTNLTIAENIAFGSNGGGVWLSHNPTGTMLNCTIANNKSTALNQIAGAIFGDGLVLKNTLITNNTAMWTPSCQYTHDDGGGNLQWPAGSLCTPTPIIADPLLGPLGYHGGSTETMMPASDSTARLIGSGCPALDQRGHPRSQTCTAGAVEIP